MSLLLQMLVGVVLGVAVAMLFAFVKVKYGRNGRGIRLLDAGKPVEAERLFTGLIDGKASQRSLAYRTALLNRAVARIDDGRPQEALEDLEQARARVAPQQKVVYAVWLFNLVYCRIALGDLAGVEEQIDELQALEVRPLLAHPTRLRIALHARRGDFESASKLAHAERVDGIAEKAPRARKTQLVIHAFVLANLDEAAPRHAETKSLLAEAAAIAAPAPTGLGAAWPEFRAFLERYDVT